MGAINVKVPDEMERQIDRYIEETGQYINRSELIRDALRRRMEDKAPLSAETLERIEQSRADMREDRTHSIDEVREYLGLDDEE